MHQPSSTIRASAEQAIPAPPETVWDILRDYREAHPAILPKTFERVEVIEGGYGAGTVALVTVKVGRKRETTTIRVTEPEPGHTMVETIEEKGATATFTVDPAPGGSRVRMAVEMPASPGVRGELERLFLPAALRRQLRVELRNLAALASVRA